AIFNAICVVETPLYVPNSNARRAEQRVVINAIAYASSGEIEAGTPVNACSFTFTPVPSSKTSKGTLGIDLTQDAAPLTCSAVYNAVPKTCFKAPAPRRTPLMRRPRM